MSLITPLEPGAAHGRRNATQQAVHATVFGRVAAAVASSRGSVHAVNEDAHSALCRPARVFVVADGVGGGTMAAMASRELVAHLHAALDHRRVGADAVYDAVLAADRAIADAIAELTDAPGAATVALCAPLNVFASRWLVAWVGDCRVYRIGAAPRALTVDDSFAQLDEAPPPGSTPEDPARMVGNGAVVRPNVVHTDLERGELLLMCSDGVHKHVDVAELLRAPAADRSLAQRCDELIALARANGSVDDATVLLLQRGRARGDGIAR
jgi:protein phosphatase